MGNLRQDMRAQQTTVPARVKSAAQTVPILRVFQFILIMPFLLLSLMPSGTMTVPVDQGQMRIVICTGSGPLAIQLNEDGSYTQDSQNNHDHKSSEKHTNMCDWAPHNSLLVAQSFAILAELSRVETPADLTSKFEQVYLRLAVLAPAARGPPHQA